MHQLNATDELPRVRCPTLVLHRPELSLLPPGSVEQIVASIPDARLALFEGASSAPYVGDWRAVVRTEAEFLGVPLTAAPVTTGRRALRLHSMKSDSLTPRERDVVDRVARGLTNRESAGVLRTKIAPR